MKSLSLYCICLIAIMALAISSARADYHYASHEGSNEYPYTSWETGAHSIQDAVDATDPRDTLYISAGDWFETVATDVYDSIAIIGMGIDSTFCHTDEYRITVMTIDYGCSVEGITFWHDDNWKCLRARVYADISVKNCKFVNSRIGVEASGGPSEISDCIFDSVRTAIFLPGWSGDFSIKNNLILKSYQYEAMLLRVRSAIVENNIIINSDDNMNGMLGTSAIIRNNIVINGSRGISVDFDSLYNNVVMNINFPSASNYGIVNSGYPFDVDSIFNNSITGSIIGVLVHSPIYISHNNFRDNDTYIYNSENHQIDSVGNIYSYPMYYSEEDLHLQAFSPLIDSGDPNYFDVDGSRSDIGAYGGPYGESYSYQDLPPGIPDSLSAIISYEDSTIYLYWLYNYEADFGHYMLHRSEESGFEPDYMNLIAEPETSYYEDNDWVFGQDYYYTIASVDSQGNISEYSEELAVIQTGVDETGGSQIPFLTELRNNYPNPFNSSTTIVYSVANLGPIPARIEISIYDISGRKVRTLIDERMGVGVYSAIWDGKTDDGRGCSSGVYFARIIQWDLDLNGRPVKLVLIR